MKKKTTYIILISIVLAGIVLDLISKIIFANIFATRDNPIVIIPDFFELTFLKNTGAAYGVLSNHTWLLIVMSILFIIGFVVYDIFYHSNSIWYIFASGLILSGAIGNLIDRIFLGYVRDFIRIELFSFVFNLADLFITAGVVCYAIFIILETIKEAKEKKDKKDTNANNDK